MCVEAVHETDQVLDGWCGDIIGREEPVLPSIHGEIFEKSPTQNPINQGGIREGR